MLYFYCPKLRRGATELMQALGAKRVRHFDGLRFLDKIDLRNGDTVICWGAHIPNLANIGVLNGLDNKLTPDLELTYLLKFGVPMSLPDRVSFYGEVPPNRIPSPDFPGYLVPKPVFESEFKLHMFNSRVLAVGTKVVRQGYKAGTTEDWNRDPLSFANPNHRSFRFGWEVCYGKHDATPNMRSIAREAVRALGLDFGVVNLLLSTQGHSYGVRNVDRGPELDDYGVKLYAKAITQWLANGKQHRLKEPEKVQAVRPGLADPILDLAPPPRPDVVFNQQQLAFHQQQHMFNINYVGRDILRGIELPEVEEGGNIEPF